MQRIASRRCHIWDQHSLAGAGDQHSIHKDRCDHTEGVESQFGHNRSGAQRTSGLCRLRLRAEDRGVVVAAELPDGVEEFGVSGIP